MTDVVPRTVAVLGIRHHGPGSARSVLAELERLRPEVVLIEGPADADAVLPLAADVGLRPPVALLAYASDAPRIASFWPFAAFSPEWQAIQWAAAHDVPVRFCDLPAAAFLAEREDDAPRRRAVRADPIAALAQAAGYDDPERWWDAVIESRLDGQPPFEALTEAMAELRQQFPPDESERDREARREAHMRQTLRAASKEFGVVAVVCGAWHAPALSGRLPSAASDAAILRGLPKRKATVTWVPWTHSRLALASGYGAGVESPGWYDHLFTTADRVVARWLTKVARVLRAHDLPASSASVIEGVRLAETLAALRGRPLAGLAEVGDATRAVLCGGDEVAAGFVTRDLVVGERLGTVPEGAPLVPLEADLRARARRLRLPIDAVDKTLALDLRKETDRGRSVLLHRLAALDIGWGEVTEDLVRGTGTFRETWSLRWRPELAVDIVDAALWGTTVEAAATAKLADRAARADELATVTAAVETTLLAELPDALPPVLAALDAKAAADADVGRLMAAVPALVRAIRYGSVRGTDTAALSAVVSALVTRVCAALPASIGGLAAEAAAELRTRLDALHAALGLAAHAETDAAAADRARWLAALAPLAERDDVHGLLAGRIVRILVDAGRLDGGAAATRFSAHLSIGVPADDKAAWAEGFLSGNGMVLVHDAELLTVLDGWVGALDGDTFVDVLPLLRRTFGAFSPAERANIGASVRSLRGGPGRAAVDLDLDLDRADAALATVGLLLGSA